jgi:hypothetical protein
MEKDAIVLEKKKTESEVVHSYREVMYVEKTTICEDEYGKTTKTSSFSAIPNPFLNPMSDPLRFLWKTETNEEFKAEIDKNFGLIQKAEADREEAMRHAFDAFYPIDLGSDLTGRTKAKCLYRGLIPCEVWYEPSVRKAAYSFQDYSDFNAYRDQQIHYGGPEKTAKEADEMLLRMKAEIERALSKK